MIGQIIFAMPLFVFIVAMAATMVMLPIWAIRDRDKASGVTAVCLWCFLIGGILMAMGI